MFSSPITVDTYTFMYFTYFFFYHLYSDSHSTYDYKLLKGGCHGSLTLLIKEMLDIY